VSALFILALSAPAVAQDVSRGPIEYSWPHKTVREDNTLVTYEPQVDEWKDFQTLEWRQAVSLTSANGEETVGAIALEGTTVVDHDTHLVTIRDIHVRQVDFPSLDAAAAERTVALVRTFLPSTVQIAMERIVASTPKSQSVTTVPVITRPPQIFVSYQLAILLDVDGPPRMAPVPGTKLEVMVNTPWRLFLDKPNSRYYLLVNKQWLTATSLNGAWTMATTLPHDLDRLPPDPNFRDLAAAIPLRAATDGFVKPKVFYSERPGELIVFDGAPAYTPIAGTRLSYANNTTSYMFKDESNGVSYYLTAGRWFSAPALDGPWMSATNNLPGGFARIPPDSPAAQVLASVPGTEEAKDAILMAQVPNTAIVSHETAAKASVIYDGAPRFEPIDGSSLQYATNTPQKVIQVGIAFYLCQSGVWFVSNSPQGPWQTAPSVPEEIYNIPPSSPLYNVTYVTQQTLPSGQVQATYTAGYLGAFAMGTAQGAVLASGTGYYYPSYIGAAPVGGYAAYYASPSTYGSGAWYNSATGRYGVSQTAYGPYGSATRSASYNPYTGTEARSASASAPFGKTGVAQAYNPYTGAYGATRQSSNAYSNWGHSVVSKNGHTAYTQHHSGSGGAVGAAETSSGNMYAGHDGNVYKNTGSGWEKYGSGGWNPVNKPSQGSAARSADPESMERSAPPESLRETQNLQHEMENRDRGERSFGGFQQRFGGTDRGEFGGFRGGRRR
jgi:hypothetical protein